MAHEWCGFNPRPRTGGDGNGHAGFASLKCFNPRPRKGGDARPVVIQSGLSNVSIHAPAQGATFGLFSSSWNVSTFQSTPPHRGRHPCVLHFVIPSGFNPRPRTGGDANRAACLYRRSVSIHAPAQGATRPRPAPPRCPLCFNPRPAQGATGNEDHNDRIPFCFNPRPRTGGDLPVGSEAYNNELFQSTPPHRGRRYVRPGVIGIRLVSIHAPAQGATRLDALRRCAERVSIHAPAQGATGRLGTDAATRICFNPRPRTGGDEGSRREEEQG